MPRVGSILHRVFQLSFSTVLLGSTFVAVILVSTGRAAEPQVDEDGSVHVPAYLLPESSLLGTETRERLSEERTAAKKAASAPRSCPPWEGATIAEMPAIRQCEAEAFYKSAEYQHLRERYRVLMTPQRIGGVYTEVFEPAAGISPKNHNRVLINVHGGGFICCARVQSHLESVPIASMGKIKVISIDYRQAPEYTFPAASEDVATVYRALLKTYKPKNIGIYGCSAGGLLTAESLAWFQKQGLPVPGASGLLCTGGTYWTEGDSGSNGSAILGWGSDNDTIGSNPYFKGISPTDPLAFPARSAEVMGRFPPSLLITSTRDVALSSVVYTHSRLIAQGVDAELHVWEGLWHGFFTDDPNLPESREAYSVIVKFFDTHLGT